MPQREVLSGECGLSPEDQELAWKLYESNGSVAETARRMNCGYHIIRSAFASDPIRLQEIQAGRAEEDASRWEGREGQAAQVCADLLDLFAGVVSHVKRCVKEGLTETDLVDPKKPERKYGTMEAVQWLIIYKVLDSAAKAGVQAAQISDQKRLYIDTRTRKEAGPDPLKMSDESLARMINEMEALGRPLPDGVRAWKEAREAKALAK